MLTDGGGVLIPQNYGYTGVRSDCCGEAQQQVCSVHLVRSDILISTTTLLHYSSSHYSDELGLSIHSYEG